jgi:hypothetical protein
MRAVALDLLVGGYGAEYDFSERAGRKWPVGDATMADILVAIQDMGPKENLPNHFYRLLHNCKAHMRSIVDESCDVVFRHLRQLFLEYAFQAREDDGAVPASIIIDHAELDLASALLDDGRPHGEGYDALLVLRRFYMGR